MADVIAGKQPAPRPSRQQRPNPPTKLQTNSLTAFSSRTTNTRHHSPWIQEEDWAVSVASAAVLSPASLDD